MWIYLLPAEYTKLSWIQLCNICNFYWFKEASANLSCNCLDNKWVWMNDDENLPDNLVSACVCHGGLFTREIIQCYCHLKSGLNKYFVAGKVALTSNWCCLWGRKSQIYLKPELHHKRKQRKSAKSNGSWVHIKSGPSCHESSKMITHQNYSFPVKKCQFVAASVCFHVWSVSYLPAAVWTHSFNRFIVYIKCIKGYILLTWNFTKPVKNTNIG